MDIIITVYSPFALPLAPVTIKTGLKGSPKKDCKQKIILAIIKNTIKSKLLIIKTATKCKTTLPVGFGIKNIQILTQCCMRCILNVRFYFFLYLLSMFFKEFS